MHLIQFECMDVNVKQFKCPECGATKVCEFAFVETNFAESDPWNGVLQRCKCAQCGRIIPAHLAERWGGISYEDATTAWHTEFRATAPKRLDD